MPDPESATDSAMHGPRAQEPQVQPSRTRTRSTPPHDEANDQAAGRAPAGKTIRSALEIAAERWGTPVGPVTSAPPEPADLTAGLPRARRDPLAPWRIWSEKPPSMADIWADMRDGARQQAAYGWGWLVPYWLAGVAAFPVACAARLLLDSSARPGRFTALLLALSLFIAGLSVAGVI